MDDFALTSPEDEKNQMLKSVNLQRNLNKIATN
jgi:hypothetical protein